MGTPVKPYAEAEGSKKEQVAQMFNNIAHSYDFLNHFFSLGIDIIWRKKALKILSKESPKTILDVATGTGDFAIQAVKSAIKPEKVIGVDISEGMLEQGRIKIGKKQLTNVIELRYGDSENLPFADESFDAFTVAFGVRNFENLNKGLSDMLRTLKKGGTGVVLEFSKPSRFPMKQFFGFYFKRIMPLVGKIVSKDSSAYTYLPESVAAFPEGENFLKIMRECGYKDCYRKELTGGVATIYIGKK